MTPPDTPRPVVGWYRYPSGYEQAVVCSWRAAELDPALDWGDVLADEQDEDSIYLQSVPGWLIHHTDHTDGEHLSTYLGPDAPIVAWAELPERRR